MLKIKKLNNRGAAHFLLPVLVITLIAAAGSYVVLRSSASIDGMLDVNKISVELGEEELVADASSLVALDRQKSKNGESGSIYDNSYFIEKEKGEYYGFLANVNSYAFKLNDKGLPIIPDTLEGMERRVKLENDKRPNKNDPERAKFDREEARGLHPDTCGAWLLSAIHENPNNRKHWIAWYHGEDRCDYDNRKTHMTLAYTESFDEGKTWRKPNYPHNRIITADPRLEAESPSAEKVKVDDAGGGRTILVGDYYYMFFRASGKVKTTKDGQPIDQLINDRIHVARSKVSDLGKPGTWKKWYCRDSGNRSTCGYTEPGIDGRSTPISVNPPGKGVTMDTLPAAGRFITYNRHLNRYITMQAHGCGFRLHASNGDDFLTWKEKTETLYPAVTDVDEDKNCKDYTVNNWNQGGDPKKCQIRNEDGTYSPTNFECKQVYMYTSIIGLQGDGERTGKELYLYYGKVYPGEGLDQRYIFRRKVSLKVKGTALEKTTRVALTAYQDKNGRRRVTTESPEPRLGYQAKSTIGYVLSDPAPGYQPLFECKKPDGLYYTMRLDTDEPYAVPVPAAAPRPPAKCNATDKLIRRIGWVSPKRTNEATVPISANLAGESAARSAHLGYALESLE